MEPDALDKCDGTVSFGLAFELADLGLLFEQLGCFLEAEIAVLDAVDYVLFLVFLTFVYALLIRAEVASEKVKTKPIVNRITFISFTPSL